MKTVISYVSAAVVACVLGAVVFAAADTFELNVMAPDSTLRRQSLRSELQAEEGRSAAAEAALAQSYWESEVYAGSPNVVAKRSIMVSPINARGQILEVDVLTYWDTPSGRLLYATNVFDKTQK